MSFIKSALGIAFVGALVACGAGSEAQDSGAGTTAASFESKVAPFEGFEKSIGPLPAAGPAQLTLAVRAGGDLSLHGSGDITDGKLVGRSQSGTMTLAASFEMKGHLKVDTGMPGAPKYDGDLPGLKDVSIPLAGDTVFDPFLLGGDKSDLGVKVPETKLPPIPLGTVPGKLHLTVSDKSEIHTTFQGTCVRVKSGAASWSGQLTPSGTLVMRGSIELQVPGFSKTIELGDISVPIALPPKAVVLGSTKNVDVADATEGECGAEPNGASNGGAPSASDGGASNGDGGAQTPVIVPDGGGGGPPKGCTATAVCPGPALGTIRGDTGNDLQQFSGVGPQFVTVHVDEALQDSASLRIEAEIVTFGGLYLGAKSLTLYEANANACTAAKVVWSYSDRVYTSWADTSATENARDFMIHVAPNGPNECEPWTLKVHR